MIVYGPKGLKNYLETVLALSASYMTYPLEIIEIEAGQLFDDGDLIVSAYPLTHRVECFGYRIQQHDKPGPLDAQKLAAENIPRGPWMQALKQGKSVTLTDGRTIDGRDYLGASQAGKSWLFLVIRSPQARRYI